MNPRPFAHIPGVTYPEPAVKPVCKRTNWSKTKPDGACCHGTCKRPRHVYGTGKTATLCTHHLRLQRERYKRYAAKNKT